MEKVRARLKRVTTALEQAGLQYAVVGGNAVASWVSTVDEEAVRNMQDVDIIIRREDLDAAKAALAAAGFVYSHVFGVDLFLDGPHAKPSQSVHVVFSGEFAKEGEAAPAPTVTESEVGGEGYRIVKLEALVRMKLTSFRDKDRTHLRDLIGVGLVDENWPARFQPELAGRLRQILDNPNG